MPLSDWELWACANTVLKTHGEQAALHLAEQLGALALRNDDAGVRTWQEIAKRIEQLQTGVEAHGTRH